MADLASLDNYDAATEGAKMKVRHPETDKVLLWDDEGDDGRPFTVTVAGADGTHGQMADARRVARRIKNDADKRQSDMTEDELAAWVIEDNIRHTASLVLEFDLKLGGGCPAASEAATLFRRFPWLRSQVDQFAGTRANFKKASQGN